MEIRPLKTLPATCCVTWLLFVWTAVGYAHETAALTDLISAKGGVVVHLGCGDGRLAEQIAADKTYVVHGLEADAGLVQAARRRLVQAGLYGRVSVSLFAGPRLPYADRLVNVLVVSKPCGVPISELDRVLAPGGELFATTALDGSLVAEGVHGAWHVFRKAWPDTIDAWPQYQHGADGNCVARDTEVGVPRHLQWKAGPRWSQHHNLPNSMTSMVCAGGRVFYILDDAPPGATGMPGRWYVYARDAFNGVLLWKRPIEHWGWPAWSDNPLPMSGLNGARRNGGRFTQPAQVGRTLMATAERVYLTLGYGAPVSVLDARTGALLTTYADTRGCDEMLLVRRLPGDQSVQASGSTSERSTAGAGNTLGRDILLAAAHVRPVAEKMAMFSIKRPVPLEKTLVAVDVETGATLWRSAPYVGISGKRGFMDMHRELNPVADGSTVCFVTKDHLVCLDLQHGRVRWQVPRPPFSEDKTRYDLRATDMVTLVCYDGKLFFAQLEPVKRIGWRQTAATLYAYSMADGRHLWQYPCASWGWVAEPDVFVIDDLVWVADRAGTMFAGLSPDTGQMQRRVSTEQAFDQDHHHRCYRNKATSSYIMTSFHGVEFFDVRGQAKAQVRPWVRSVCRYGFMPANGLMYNGPDACGCYPGAKLTGFNALAAGRGVNSELRRVKEEEERLVKGPAYDTPHPSSFTPHTSNDWPVFRHDAGRSGMTAARVPKTLKTVWSTNLGGRPTSAVVAQGRVYAAVPERFAVKALDVANGLVLWQFIAGSRVDSAPSIYQGMLLFGSADGHVYCLGADDGALRWRFRAAPQERLIAVAERLESTWPVHGSVVVQDGKVYVVAGRSTFLDGGFSTWVLDAVSGEVLAAEQLDDSAYDFLNLKLGNRTPISGESSDILVSDGTALYMRKEKLFDLAMGNKGNKRIRTQAGFLDDTWFNRTSMWYWGTQRLGDYAVADAHEAYAFRLYEKNNFNDVGFFRPGSGTYTLCAYRWAGEAEQTDRGGKRAAQPPGPVWKRPVPVTVRAMIKAADALCIAGSPDRVSADDPWRNYEGRGEGVVMTFTALDGKPIDRVSLPSAPVQHGLCAAGGSLYVSCANGDVVRIGL